MMVLENLSESTTFKQISSPYNWNMSNLADAMKSNIPRLKEQKDKWGNIRLEYTPKPEYKTNTKVGQYVTIMM